MPTRGFFELADLVDGRRILVLSGAGCSTESGIPDYRGPGSAKKARRPILYQEFIRDASARARYWARSAVGWSRVADARPNPGHHALARLEEAGLVNGLITQNVDGLHHRAGSRRVVELHGNLAEVVCLDCGASESRREVQRRLSDLNHNLSARAEDAVVERDTVLAPDGDAELSPEAMAGFQVASCLRCGGVLKPDVVFFGENVPKGRVEEAWRLFAGADVLLVVGSSLAVYSGYRFVAKAAKEEKPVAIVNLGETRGDDVAGVKVDGRTGLVLPALADMLL